MMGISLDDFRIAYLEEARNCLRASNKITTAYPRDWHQKPEFWANLFGAVANSNIAAADGDVCFGLEVRQEQRLAEAKKLKKHLDERLGRK